MSGIGIASASHHRSQGLSLRVLGWATFMLMSLCTPVQAQDYAPSWVELDNRGWTQYLRARWGAPPSNPDDDFGSPTQYQAVLYAPGGQVAECWSNSMQALECEFSGLTPGDGYWLVVSTIPSGYGTSIASRETYSGGTVLPPVPAVPSITSSSAGNGSVTLSWSSSA